MTKTENPAPQTKAEGDREYDTSRNVSDDEIEQWAAMRADDAGFLARKLLAERRRTIDREMFVHPEPQAKPVGYVTLGELNQLKGGVSCVDLFAEFTLKEFKMVPLYEHPPQEQMNARDVEQRS